eukprot:TRINITY_DN68848_c0_g1_i1.p1 TRINITY_DN68848_c0_g1~~TRINITY_DN68848_c0_g1_i1.p1  ORF type:complete len:355 (+),score=33.63 TRINITY_DN68848_c0_g1_i1:74-1138(+)
MPSLMAFWIALVTSAFGLVGVALAISESPSCSGSTCEVLASSFIQMKSSRSVTKAGCHPVPFQAPEMTSCPKAAWLDAMVEADPEPGKVFMDVGCNKGDDAIEMMERWDTTGHFWSKKKWMDLYEKVLGSKPSYQCGPPSTNFSRVPASNKTVQRSVGVCVEPMEANVQMLRNITSILGYTPRGRHGSFHTVQAALSDHAKPGQTIEFADGGPGMEWFGMQSVTRTHTSVPLSTVDHVKDDLQLAKVDILRVDTEGADPAVLLGAKSTLKTVRYLEFEVHRNRANSVWEKTPVKAVVASLSQQGFDCYWAGNNGLLLSLNACWEDHFEHGTWANAVCVKRNDVWASTLKAFSRP